MEIMTATKKIKRPVEVFCCYAREDQPYAKELIKHLMPLQREGLITLWADTNINAGAEWEKEIHQHLTTSHIILLLVSPDFIASHYCYGIEMTYSMERHKRGEAQVIPIILRPVDWKNTPFAKLQALPRDAHPIISSKWRFHDEGFADVARGIREAVAASFVKKEQHDFAEDMKEASDHKQEEANRSVNAKNPQALLPTVEKPSLSPKRGVIFRPITRRNFFLVAVVLILLSVSFASVPWGIIKARLSGPSLTLSPAVNLSGISTPSFIPTPSFYGNPQFQPPKTATIFCGGARDGGKGWEGSSPVLSYSYFGSDSLGHVCEVNVIALTPPQHFLTYNWTIPLLAKSVDLWIYISPVWHSAQALYSLQFDGPSQARRLWSLDQRFCDHWLILGNARIPQGATQVELIVESTNTAPGYFADNAVALDSHNYIPTSSAIPSTIQQCKKR